MYSIEKIGAVDMQSVGQPDLLESSKRARKLVQEVAHQNYLDYIAKREREELGEPMDEKEKKKEIIGGTIEVNNIQYQPSTNISYEKLKEALKNQPLGIGAKEESKVEIATFLPDDLFVKALRAIYDTFDSIDQVKEITGIDFFESGNFIDQLVSVLLELLECGMGDLSKEISSFCLEYNGGLLDEKSYNVEDSAQNFYDWLVENRFRELKEEN